MFTGIVSDRGEVVGREAVGDGVRLSVAPSTPLSDVAIGESIALDGCCLTVVSETDGVLAFEAVPETLRRTTLGDLAVGDRVNLERALRMGDALGGHWVQGHVDAVGHVADLAQVGEDVRMTIAAPAVVHDGLVPKGSVTVDGVSLTVGEVVAETDGGGRFAVYLIPHTLAVTGLGGKAVGDRVNLEGDVLSRYVARHVARLLGAASEGQGD